MGDQMHRGLHTPRPTPARNRVGLSREARPPAATVLGRSHPLVETVETLAEARRQALAVVAVLVPSLALASVGIRWAQTATVIAGAMLCVLTAAELNSRRRLRRQALKLILEGREGVPVAAVEEQRRRLLDGRHRTMLAATFENLADDAESPGRWPSASVFHRATVAAVADELRDVGLLLRSGPSRARGVALAREVLTDGVRSPLLRGEADVSGHELRRIRFLLASTAASLDARRARAGERRGSP
jgi:hypothetical protein